MLKIQESESIHSLIYRTHVLNGVSNFSNIITPKGLWQRYPSILKSTLHLYQPVQDNLFYELLKKINYFKVAHNMFIMPKRGILELKHFFTGETLDSYNTDNFPVKYCKYCIVEQICELGFPYFKNSWLLERYCDEHDDTLTEVNENTYSKCVKSLTKIHQSEPPIKKGSFLSKQSEAPEIEFDSFAPCMAMALHKYVLLRVDDLPNNAFKTQTVTNKALRQPYVLHRVYDTIKKEQHYSYFELMRFAELKVLAGGWINKDSILIGFYKLKTSNCSNCYYSSCLANKTIKYAKEPCRLVELCELNNQILFNYVTSSRYATYKEKRNAIQKLSYDSKLAIIKKQKLYYSLQEPYFF